MSKEYELQINLETTVVLKLLQNRRKSTAVKINKNVKINGKEIKADDKCVYLDDVMKKNEKILNKI